jgi:hypothetical protein
MRKFSFGHDKDIHNCNLKKMYCYKVLKVVVDSIAISNQKIILCSKTCQRRVISNYYSRAVQNQQSLQS